MARIQPAPIGLGSNARGALVNPNSDIRQPSLGGIIGDAAGDLAQAIEADNIRRDRLEQVKKEEEFKARTIEELDKLDPLADDYENKVNEALSLLRDEYISSTKFNTPGAADEFAARLEMLTQGNLTIAMKKRRSALSDEGVRVRQESEDKTFAAIRQDPDGYDAYLAEFSNNAAKLNISINPTLLPKMNEAFADQAVIARAQGYALAGRYDEARAFLDANQGQLDPSAFQGAKRSIRGIEEQQKRDRLARSASTIAELSVRTIDAESDTELTKLRAEVDSLNARGFFKDQEGHRVALIRQIEGRREAILRREREMSDALARYESGTGVDTQKQADLAFANVMNDFQARHPDATAEQQLNMVAQFAAESGFLPSSHKRIIENAERTENPQLLEAAARIYDRLAVAAPNVKSGIEEQNSRVRLTSVTAELLGIGYDQAADMVIKRVPDAATLKERRAQFDKDFPKLDMRDMLDSLDIFDDPKTVPAAVARDAERSLRLYYDMFGDKGVAQAAMKRQMMERYGLSTIGGAERAMKYPPERFNPLPARVAAELDADFFSKAITADVRRFLEKSGIAPAGGDESDPWAPDKNGQPAFALVADDTTERDIAAGRQPSYDIRVRNSFGLAVSIGKRFRVPTLEEFSAFPEYAEHVAKQQAKAKRKQEDGRADSAANRRRARGRLVPDELEAK